MKQPALKPHKSRLVIAEQQTPPLSFVYWLRVISVVGRVNRCSRVCKTIGTAALVSASMEYLQWVGYQIRGLDLLPELYLRIDSKHIQKERCPVMAF